MKKIKNYLLIVSSVIFSLSPGLLFAQESTDKMLALDKEGIKVYFYGHDNVEFGTFKAVAHIDSTLDSVLAVMFDHQACQDWIYACKDSRLLKEISFNERYHYQILDIPFPFKDREFIFHSKLMQDPDSNTITIRTIIASDDCQDGNFYLCDHPKENGHVKVNVSVGIIKLEADEKGVLFTWIQHTNPEGYLPGWLVNRFIEQTPYQTLKGLRIKVKERPYSTAQIISDKKGVFIGLENKKQNKFNWAQHKNYN